VRELERRNAGLSGDLARQREETKKAGLLFMGAADRYEHAAREQARARAAELEGARRAILLLMGAADAYESAAKRRARAKEEELEDARRAAAALMGAADAYQQEARRQIKEKVEELRVMAARKAEADARAADLEAELHAALSRKKEMEVDRDKVKAENCELRAEVERLVMGFDDEKTEIVKEFGRT